MRGDGPFGAGHAGGDIGDAQTGGVGKDGHLGRQGRVQPAEQGLLLRQILHDGLDDHAGACEGLIQVVGRRQKLLCRRRGVRVKQVVLRQLVHAGHRAAHPGRRARGVSVHHDRFVAGQRAAGRDAAAHEPRADNHDGIPHHFRSHLPVIRSFQANMFTAGSPRRRATAAGLFPRRIPG